jgi:acyl-CoA oxidase
MSTIEEILAAERKKVVVDVNALSEFLYSAEEVPKIIKLFAKPGLPYDFNSFNKSRVDLIKESLRTYPPYLQSLDLSENNVLAYFMRIVLQGPSSIHSAMFVKCIEFLGTETQQEEWYKKAVTYQIVGCYAQTELGHGSDVQNL